MKRTGLDKGFVKANGKENTSTPKAAYKAFKTAPSPKSVDKAVSHVKNHVC